MLLIDVDVWSEVWTSRVARQVVLPKRGEACYTNAIESYLTVRNPGRAKQAGRDEVQDLAEWRPASS